MAGQTIEEGGTPPLRSAGSLVETPIPRLLHDRYAHRSTGLLHLERGGVEKVVYLRDGQPIFVRSNLLRECLGRILLRDGRLSPSQHEESLRRMHGTGRRQGSVLVEMGVLTPASLRESLREQTAQRVLEIFGWPEGTYRFYPAQRFRKTVPAVPLSPAALILKGMSRYYPPHRTAQLLLPHRNRYPVPARESLYRFEELELSPADTGVLAECRGDLTVQQILESRPGNRRQAEQLLAALLLGGLLESRREPRHYSTRRK